MKTGRTKHEEQTPRSQDAFQIYLQGLRAGSDLREEQTPRSQDAFQITSKVRGQKVTYARGRHPEVKTPFNLPAGSESRK